MSDLPLRRLRAVRLHHPGAPLATRKAVAYGARYLAALGAELLVVDTDDRRWPTPLAAATRLRSWLDEGAAPLRAEPSRCGALVESLRPDVLMLAASPAQARELGFRAVRAPAPISVALSPWGWSGPWADRPGEEGVLDAASGLAWAIGEPRREPLALPYGVGSYQAGLHAAAAALAGVLGAMPGGRVRGERAPGWVDVSVAQVLAFLCGVNSRIYVPHGSPWARAGRRASGSGGPYPYAIFACADGEVAVICRSLDEWRRLVEAMGSPAWASEPRYSDPYRMGREYPDEVDALAAPWFASRTVDAVLRALREHRVAAGAVNRMDDVAREAGFEWLWWGAGAARRPGIPLLLDGAPVSSPPPMLSGEEVAAQWRETPSPWALRSAPPSGAPDAGPAGGYAPAERGAGAARAAVVAPWRPLEGWRVLDLGRIWSGPFVGAHLADLGAKVIKVESRTVPDNARLRGAPVDPPARAGADPLEVVPYFLNLNRGKLGVDLDLRADAARLAFLRLASGADALIENFTAEVMPRLGLGRDVLSAAAPALVHLAMPPSLGLGSLAGMRAYAPIMTATGGLEGLVGYAGEEPVGMLTVGYGDPNAAAHALVALLAVWCARTRGAAWAREVTLPQTEATVATLGEPLMEAVGGSAPGPSGNRREYLAVSVIERREGGYVATSGADGQPASESRVLTLRELEAHAHWRARGLTTLIDHPVAGPVQIWLLPWLTETGRPWPAGPAPLLGQHDDLLTAGGRPPEP